MHIGDRIGDLARIADSRQTTFVLPPLCEVARVTFAKFSDIRQVSSPTAAWEIAATAIVQFANLLPADRLCDVRAQLENVGVDGGGNGVGNGGGRGGGGGGGGGDRAVTIALSAATQEAGYSWCTWSLCAQRPGQAPADPGICSTPSSKFALLQFSPHLLSSTNLRRTAFSAAISKLGARRRSSVISCTFRPLPRSSRNLR
jgi:hypothetical protein